MRTFVYVDGFNLYYAIRSSGCKWLNLVQLAKALLPTARIEKIKYYTARVSGIADPGQPRRQQLYLSALGTLAEVETHFGSFLAKDYWRPLLNLPIGNRQVNGAAAPFTLVPQQYHVDPDPALVKSVHQTMVIGTHGHPSSRRQSPAPDAVRVQICAMEEKGSDVNLAVHLVNDAWAKRFEAAAVVSNDTDLVEPIRIVTQELGLPVTLLCAHSRGAAGQLGNVATSVRHINLSHLKASVFPDPVVSPGRPPIPKPATW